MGSENNRNLDSYEELISKFNKLDIINKELTLFDAGARGHFENPTTELLSFFLDSKKAHGLQDCFLNGLQAVIEHKVELPPTLGNLQSVETEVSTAKGNRIDLLLETERAIFIIECKIYHEQNNPFDDYANYGYERSKNNGQEKVLVKLVLCLNGRINNDIEASAWHGMSYHKLAEGIEAELSKALLKNPYNKWGLFAREFLLHLKELNTMGEIDKKEIDFLSNNINDYFKLSEYLYRNIIPKIASKIEIDLNNSELEGFSYKSKTGKWFDYEPYIKFYNEKWLDTSSCVVLCIRNDTKSSEMKFTIHIDFFDKLGISSDKAENLLEKYKIDSTTYKNESDGRNIWRFMWKYNDFDIKKVSERIVELMKILDKYEANEY